MRQAGSDELVVDVERQELLGCLPQHHRGERAVADDAVGVVRLQHEETCDAPVVLLGHRPHLARCDDADEPGALEHLHVVAGGSLRNAQRLGELRRARCPLTQEDDDSRSEDAGQRPNLVGLADLHDLGGVVVDELRTVDSSETYEKSRPFARWNREPSRAPGSGSFGSGPVYGVERALGARGGGQRA